MTSLFTTASEPPWVNVSFCEADQLLPSSDQLWQPFIWCRIVRVADFCPAASADPESASRTNVVIASFMVCSFADTRAGRRSGPPTEMRVLRDGNRRGPRVPRRALAEEVESELTAAQRPADHQDTEPDAGEQERQADDDAEQRDVLGEEARVERCRERRLGDPDVPDRVVDRLAVLGQGLRRIVRALAVSGREPRQLRIRD